jgi:DNA-binding transcriptional LysR family regulator
MTTFYFVCGLGWKRSALDREETMEFQQLEMFAAVVETGNISRAAERVCRTAPAVSIALRKLEEEMGVPLFDRSDRHNHQLTAAGKLMYSHTTRILEMRGEAAASVKDFIQGEGRNLRLGTHESTSLYLLPSLLQAFHETRPDAQTEVLCGSSERLLEALGRREIELALIAEAPNDDALQRHLIMQDDLVLITSPTHRLAGLKEVKLGDLAGEFLLVQGIKSVLRERIVRALKESGTPFKLGVENIAIEAIKRMVAKGLGIGFVPLMCVREEAARDQLIILSLKGVSSKWDLWLVRRRDRSMSSVARAFIEATISKMESAESSEEGVPERTEKNSSTRSKTKSVTLHRRSAIHC